MPQVVLGKNVSVKNCDIQSEDIFYRYNFYSLFEKCKFKLSPATYFWEIFSLYPMEKWKTHKACYLFKATGITTN